MGTDQYTVMTINSGSSSVKLTLFTGALQHVLTVAISNIGQPNTALTVEEAPGTKNSRAISIDNHEAAINSLLDAITDELSAKQLAAIGHRIVHGGHMYDRPTVLTADTVSRLKDLSAFDPEHMQAATTLIEICMRRFPQIPQVACFDTAFYRDLPTVARLLPLPKKLESLGLRRYGFHGLSYEYLLKNFREVAGETAAHGKIVLAHLGSGASLTAVKDGKPYDTTMSFTPASGIPMSTRAGDLDPGIPAFLHQQTGMTIEEFSHMIHFESGLLGVSGMSADMELLIRESAHNQDAANAVDLFCYQVQKTVGSFAAVLGGLDSLIFAGGMGENAPVIREKVCEGLAYLGIKLDTERNADHEFLISSDDSSAGVHVMHTDEAVIIASQTQQTIEREGT